MAAAAAVHCSPRKLGDEQPLSSEDDVLEAGNGLHVVLHRRRERNHAPRANTQRLPFLQFPLDKRSTILVFFLSFTCVGGDVVGGRLWPRVRVRVFFFKFQVCWGGVAGGRL